MLITTKFVSSNPVHGECTTLCDKVCQWLATGRWFSLVSSTNKSEILLKMVLKHHKLKSIIILHMLKSLPKTKICVMFHLKKFCYFLLFRKLLPDLARSLVQTAIDPVFRPKNAKGRGNNWFTKIWNRECHLICSLLYTSVNVSFYKNFTYCH